MYDSHSPSETSHVIARPDHLARKIVDPRHDDLIAVDGLCGSLLCYGYIDWPQADVGPGVRNNLWDCFVRSSRLWISKGEAHH